jgi:hypothetical protein
MTARAPVCVVCGQERYNAGPFRLDSGERLPLVCGRCKVRITFATPGRKERLEQDIRDALIANGFGGEGQS